MGERALLGGRFEIGLPIGSGGYGTVFRARDHAGGNDVAIKLVPHGFGSEALAVRLRSEAAILGRLSSRHVARIVASGEDPVHGVWLATELVDGVPLAPAALGRALLPHEVLRVARGMLDGLASAHAAGVVHGDVKPANVLVPLGTTTLDSAKLIDFGLGRVTARAAIADEIGERAPREGVVIGTARWMAPEVLAGAEVDARADVWAAGLVLFELLGVGELFPTEDPRDALRARLANEPEIASRVPAPLADVLARMLARDPARRYADAGHALQTVLELDTAPVSVLRDESPASAGRVSFPPPRMSSPPISILPVSSSLRPRTPSVPPVPRLTTLPANAEAALAETLRHLDLPMLDALARRERGGPTGRIARAVALALRLELDAAALVLEPLTSQSAVARAIGTTVLAPCARRVTRGRVDSDRDDMWTTTVTVELAALLAALACVICARDEAARAASRAGALLERVGQNGASPVGVELEGTLRMAHAAARVRSGDIDPGVALEIVAPLVAMRPTHRFDRVVRALAVAVISAPIDDLRAREELERASAIAAETGTTLLDAYAAAALGTLLTTSATRMDDGLAVLERASTLLAHGDAPRLEHEAEHQRAAALVATGRWAEAVAHLRTAREAAHAERALDAEIASASYAVIAYLALGERLSAHETAQLLGDARLATTSGRVAPLAWIARALDACACGDIDGAEDALAEAEVRVRQPGDASEARVLVEVVSVLLDAARGALPDPSIAVSELLRTAHERRFSAFYWFDVLAAVVVHVDDALARQKIRMKGALDRITEALGPSSNLARERRTSAPPPSMREGGA